MSSCLRSSQVVTSPEVHSHSSKRTPLQLSRCPSASSRVLPNCSPTSSSSSISALSLSAGTVRRRPAHSIHFHNPMIFFFPVHLFWPVFKIRWRAWCARIRTLSLSSAVREAAARKFLDDLCPVGQNPLDFTLVTKAWAGMYLCLLVQTLIRVANRLLLVISSQASMIVTTIYILAIHLIPR